MVDAQEELEVNVASERRERLVQLVVSRTTTGSVRMSGPTICSISGRGAALPDEVQP